MQERDNPAKQLPLDKDNIQTKVHDAMRAMHEKTGMSPAESGAALAASTLPAASREIQNEMIIFNFNKIAGIAMTHFLQESAAEQINPRQAATYEAFKKLAA